MFLQDKIKCRGLTSKVRISLCVLAVFVFSWGRLASAQNQGSSIAEQHSTPMGKGADYLLNYLNMAGTLKADDFYPLTQRERTVLYLKTMMNPLGYLKAGFSGGIDQWKDKPSEWEQGASGYAKRFGNIVGQYSIQRTVTFSLARALHEDNRYFNSGKKGFWRRSGYALASGVLARDDDGSRHPSISQLGGVAAGAFLSRSWQPPSQRSAGDAAVSFGITMASNTGFSVVKEFLPDVGRLISKKSKNRSSSSHQASFPLEGQSVPRQFQTPKCGKTRSFPLMARQSAEVSARN
jgi:hypothetical protein